MEKESPHFNTEAKDVSELVLQSQATNQSWKGITHQWGCPENTYSGEEAAQYVTGNSSCRFFNTDTVWNRSVNTAKPT